MAHVAVLGASTKPQRYSHKAVQMLLDHGHQVYPVSPTGAEVLGQKGYRSLGEVPEPVDTVTVYLNPQRLDEVLDELIADPPRRVILNPGAESDAARRRLEEAGVQVEEACTLVMLSTGQF